ncbi:MAG: hypothetical protein U9N45_03405, partial [Gemmatimonadota bacterium]|nr:hypothetical protein [Gemmatimonadota bacterium]
MSFKSNICLKSIFLVSGFLAILATAAAADLSLSKMFGDNMVLQRWMRTPVWGIDRPGERVKIEIAGHSAITVADEGGKWIAWLEGLEAGGPYTLEATGSSKVVVNNILVGEVWVCSGQSNMAMQVSRCLDADKEISSADYPLIRQFMVQRVKAAEPAEKLSDPKEGEEDGRFNNWTVCSPSTVGAFTAAGYFFARCIHLKS